MDPLKKFVIANYSPYIYRGRIEEFLKPLLREDQLDLVISDDRRSPYLTMEEKYQARAEAMWDHATDTQKAKAIIDYVNSITKKHLEDIAKEISQ
jgi:hypothetical protein